MDTGRFISLSSTRWNVTHRTANAETKQRGFWKLGVAFVFITQKSNKGVGSRQPRQSFPLCAPRLPLRQTQGGDLINRQTGHLTTDFLKINLEKGIIYPTPLKLFTVMFSCFLAKKKKNRKKFKPPTSREAARFHTDPNPLAFIPLLGHIVQSFSKYLPPPLFRAARPVLKNQLLLGTLGNTRSSGAPITASVSLPTTDRHRNGVSRAQRPSYALLTAENC